MAWWHYPISFGFIVAGIALVAGAVVRILGGILVPYTRVVSFFLTSLKTYLIPF